eukprot:TRINITY_DN105326_c0_g1_i1.p1 TRINITY_DN105326_c0_g1~~TRINITY_DN105326_c0_g1_i1.p1  ORF type:complete len:655 (-),score=97.63 TRINITY_DN105326_c0_g1_i1:34-1998(-)
MAPNTTLEEIKPEVLQQIWQKVERRSKGVESFLKSMSSNLMQASLQAEEHANQVGDLGALRDLLRSVRLAHWQAENFHNDVNADYTFLNNTLAGRHKPEFDVLLLHLKNQLHKAHIFCDTLIGLERDLCTKLSSGQVDHAQRRKGIGSCSSVISKPSGLNLYFTEEAGGPRHSPEIEHDRDLDYESNNYEDKLVPSEIVNADEPEASQASECSHENNAELLRDSGSQVTPKLSLHRTGPQPMPAVATEQIEVPPFDDLGDSASIQLNANSLNDWVPSLCRNSASAELAPLVVPTYTPSCIEYEHTTEQNPVLTPSHSVPEVVADIDAIQMASFRSRSPARLGSLESVAWSVVCQHLCGELLALRTASVHIRDATKPNIEAWLLMSWAGADLPSPRALPSAEAMPDRMEVGFIDDLVYEEVEECANTALLQSAQPDSCFDPAVLTRSFWPAVPQVEAVSNIESFRVHLHVYDVSHHPSVQWLNSVFASPYSPIKLGGIFHVGVEIDRKEWSFGHKATGSGVFSTTPLGNVQHHFRETIALTPSKLGRGEIAAIIQEMSDRWQGRTYHLLRRNCCHFADELCQKLGAGRIPEWTHRIAGIGGKAAEVIGGLDRQASLMHFSQSLANHERALAGPLRAALPDNRAYDVQGAAAAEGL